jgi:hypothetical protein
MKRIYLDIETRPLPERVDLFLKPYPEYNQDDCKMGNIKDPEKREAKLAAHRASYMDDKVKYRQEAIDKAALSPNTAEILCIQVAEDDNDVEILSGDERAMLVEFWKMVGNNVGQVINWTGNNKGGNFDKNFLFRRSWFHGVQIPYFPHDGWKNCAKAFLADADWGTYYKLENAAIELGFKVINTGPVTGATFAKFWETDRASALVYARQDVVLLRQIWKRIRGLDQEPEDENQMKML